ncbi:MAG: hypothetical protein JWN13_3273 [Betaproteobacteria bacterium]|jgi:hypothetical protein|nr:hypothetical protein [Betaproteobacteria bacterium]
MRRNGLVVAAGVALIVLTIASYKVYDAQATRINVIALVSDTMERLKAALAAQAAGTPMVDVQAHATAAEAHVAALRNMNTSSVTRLADAADDALVASREIMRRQANIDRSRNGLVSSLDLLARHLKSNRSSNDWTREAVRMKGAVDKDLRDYRIAVESYATLLESFPASQARLAPYVAPTLLIDPKLMKDARQQALDAFEGADQNIKRVANIGGSRGSGARAP